MDACRPSTKGRKLTQSVVSRWVRVAFGLFLSAGAGLAQTTSSSNQTALELFSQGQGALANEEQNLIAQGATPQAIYAWHQRNASRIASQQLVAQALSLRVAALQSQTITAPVNASAALRDFLATKGSLANAQAQIHNQLVLSLPANPTFSQIAQEQQQELQLIQQQHANDFSAQKQRAQTLAQETAQQGLQTLPSLRIPSNASPQLTAFLTLRNQLMRGEVQLWQEYTQSDPAALHAALLQWRKQNATQIQQLRQDALALSQTNVVNQ